MRINLALLNILNSPRKTALSISGIGVAILLVFMQLGFRGAVENTATNIYGKLDFDVLVRSPNYLHFVDAGTTPSRYLDEIAGAEGVTQANFLDVSVVNWRNPVGQMKGILLLGVSPSQSPFRDRHVDRDFKHLLSLDSILIDRQSHHEFGPVNQKTFAKADVGREFEVGGQAMKITGLFDMGAGLAANGAAIVADKSFQMMVPTFRDGEVTFGLIKLEEDVPVDSFVAAIQARFTDPQHGPLVEVLTRDQVLQRELDRWLGETPIGFIFTLGVLISLIVGAAIVYMVLGNDVANRLHEYATLKAMGYSNVYMAGVVIRQAGYLALFSFVPALVVALLLYWSTSWLANLAMEMTMARVGFVLLLTLMMCGCAGTLALKKLWQAEPAELF
ncbi:MAG: FtsX-like permease family protein [Pirellulaceae bacterium]